MFLAVSEALALSASALIALARNRGARAPLSTVGSSRASVLAGPRKAVLLRGKTDFPIGCPGRATRGLLRTVAARHVRVPVVLRAIPSMSPGFAPTTADGRHVFPVAAHGHPALSACFTGLPRIELVGRALGVGSSAPFAGDLLLLSRIHRREAAIAAAA